MDRYEIEQRNLDPHRPARCAVWLFNIRYCQQKGGIMEFWDTLSETEKNTCRRMALEIITTRPETDSDLNAQGVDNG